MDRGQIRFISEDEVRKLITPEKALALVEDVFKEFARGDTVNPVKLSLQIFPYHEGHINSMPSYIKKGDLCGVKVVSVHQNNMKNYGLPTTLGTIILHDPETGLPYSIMGGTHITDLRTGAVSGVMAKYLARKDSKSMAVIGAGAQGFTSMEMTLLAIPSIEKVCICDLSLERCESFKAKAQLAFPNVCFDIVNDSVQAMSGVDVAIFATSASVPILEKCPIDDGVCVVCVSEKLTPKTIAMFDGWYLDFAECAIERYNADGRHAAELMGLPYEELTMEMTTGEIGDIIIGKTTGRTNDKQKMLAASVGMSIEDVICARAVYEAAVEANVGKVLDFQN